MPSPALQAIVFISMRTWLTGPETWIPVRLACPGKHPPGEGSWANPNNEFRMVVSLPPSRTDTPAPAFPRKRLSSIQVQLPWADPAPVPTRMPSPLALTKASPRMVLWLPPTWRMGTPGARSLPSIRTFRVPPSSRQSPYAAQVVVSSSDPWLPSRIISWPWRASAKIT